jgi:UDP-glucose 4-epimerase
MRVLITGSSGHLGEALARTFRELGHGVVGLDLLAGPFTTHVGSIADRSVVRRCMIGVETVFHAATLHKPHVVTHSRQDFVDTNVTGTLNVLEEAATAAVGSFVYTSTTSVFGAALVPPAGAPAAWVTEEVVPVPKNIYGVTKAAAEDLCQLFHRRHGLACIVLRTSRFFPEEDDDHAVREAYADANVKVNEYLYRRVDLEDVVSAHRSPPNVLPRWAFAVTLSARQHRLRPTISQPSAPMRRWRRAAMSRLMRMNTRAAAARWSQASIASMSMSAHATSLAGSRATILRRS